MERSGKGLIILFVTIILIGLGTSQIGFDNPNLPRVDRASALVDRFLDLIDTPSSYVGEGGSCVIVSAGETGLVFGNCSNATGGGGSGDITAVNAIGPYILEGGVTGSVNISFSESQLNKTISLEGVSLGFNSTLDVFINETGDRLRGNLVLINESVSIEDNSSSIKMFFEGGILVVEG